MTGRPWIALAALFLIFTRSASAELAYDAAHPIFDGGKKRYAINELGTVLGAAMQSGRPVIVYLHGRGLEPEKSFNLNMRGGGAVLRLMREYGAAVILVNWNSYGKDDDRSVPLEHVPEGARTFHEVLTRLASFEQQNPHLPRPSLLVHSMGSIVLAEAVTKFGWPAPSGQPLFSNVLLSEPDADSQGHDRWLAIVANHERVYVTQNKRDSVLQRSTDSRKPESNFALGLLPVPPYAANANYVDLTEALGTKLIFVHAHQIFAKKWMGGNVDTCRFVTMTLQGARFEPSDIPGIAVSAPSHYKATKQVDKKHACFKSTEEKGDAD